MKENADLGHYGRPALVSHEASGTLYYVVNTGGQDDFSHMDITFGATGVPPQNFQTASPSAWSYTGLERGKSYKVTLRPVDRTGNIGEPISYSWSVSAEPYLWWDATDVSNWIYPVGDTIWHPETNSWTRTYSIDSGTTQIMLITKYDNIALDWPVGYIPEKIRLTTPDTEPVQLYIFPDQGASEVYPAETVVVTPNTTEYVFNPALWPSARHSFDMISMISTTSAIQTEITKIEFFPIPPTRTWVDVTDPQYWTPREGTFSNNVWSYPTGEIALFAALPFWAGKRPTRVRITVESQPNEWGSSLSIDAAEINTWWIQTDVNLDQYPGVVELNLNTTSGDMLMFRFDAVISKIEFFM